MESSDAQPFQDQLLAAASLPDQKSKLDKYSSLLAAAVSSASGDACKAFVEHCAWETAPIALCRPPPLTPCVLPQCCRTAIRWWYPASC